MPPPADLTGPGSSVGIIANQSCYYVYNVVESPLGTAVQKLLGLKAT